MGVAADFRYALRTFRLAPGFHCLLIGILAIGIATSTAMFSIVDGVLLRLLPYRDPGRLVTLTSVAADPRFDSNGSLPYYDFEQLQRRTRSFEDVAVTYRTGWSTVTLTGGRNRSVRRALSFRQTSSQCSASHPCSDEPSRPTRTSAGFGWPC